MVNAYDEIYAADIMETQGDMFMYIRELFSGIDDQWFIETYMKSETRQCLNAVAPKWAGVMYSLYQWKYNIPSKVLIDVLTLDVIERRYNPFHELGEDAALIKLHEIFLSL